MLVLHFYPIFIVIRKKFPLISRIVLSNQEHLIFKVMLSAAVRWHCFPNTNDCSLTQMWTWFFSASVYTHPFLCCAYLPYSETYLTCWDAVMDQIRKPVKIVYSWLCQNQYWKRHKINIYIDPRPLLCIPAVTQLLERSVILERGKKISPLCNA